MKTTLLTLALICLSTITFSQELFQVEIKSTLGCKEYSDIKSIVDLFESENYEVFRNTIVDLCILEKCTPFYPGEILILLKEDKETGILKIRKSGFDQTFWIKEFIPKI